MIIPIIFRGCLAMNRSPQLEMLPYQHYSFASGIARLMKSSKFQHMRHLQASCTTLVCFHSNWYHDQHIAPASILPHTNPTMENVITRKLENFRVFACWDPPWAKFSSNLDTKMLMGFWQLDLSPYNSPSKPIWRKLIVSLYLWLLSTLCT